MSKLMSLLAFVCSLSTIPSWAAPSVYQCYAQDLLGNPQQIDENVEVELIKILPPIGDKNEGAQYPHTFYKNRADLFIAPSDFGGMGGGASLRVYSADGKLLGLTAVSMESLSKSFQIDMKYFDGGKDLKAIRVACGVKQQ
jgi:hypothetical protein